MRPLQFLRPSILSEIKRWWWWCCCVCYCCLFVFITVLKLSLCRIGRVKNGDKDLCKESGGCGCSEEEEEGYREECEDTLKSRTWLCPLNSSEPSSCTVSTLSRKGIKRLDFHSRKQSGKAAKQKQNLHSLRMQGLHYLLDKKAHNCLQFLFQET